MLDYTHSTAIRAVGEAPDVVTVPLRTLRALQADALVLLQRTLRTPLSNSDARENRRELLLASARVSGILEHLAPLPEGAS